MKQDMNKLNEKLELLAQKQTQTRVCEIESGSEAYKKLVETYTTKLVNARSEKNRVHYQEILDTLRELAQSPDTRRKLYNLCRDIVAYQEDYRDSAVISMSFKDGKGGDKNPPSDKTKVLVNGRSLEQFLKEKPTANAFSELIYDFMNKKGMTPKDVYTNAKLSRQDFSRITKPGNMPKRPTVYSMAIGLRLSWAETERLLLCAGFAYREYVAFDCILWFYIESRNYDINEINMDLYKYGQPTLANNERIKVNDRDFR